MVLADLQRAPLVKKCVLEAIRLHSPGTVARRVTKSFTLHVVIGICLCYLIINFINCQSRVFCRKDRLDRFPRVWNRLPADLRQLRSTQTFRRHLKTFYLLLLTELR